MPKIKINHYGRIPYVGRRGPIVNPIFVTDDCLKILLKILGKDKIVIVDTPKKEVAKTSNKETKENEIPTIEYLVSSETKFIENDLVKEELYNNEESVDEIANEVIEEVAETPTEELSEDETVEVTSSEEEVETENEEIEDSGEEETEEEVVPTRKKSKKKKSK